MKNKKSDRRLSSGSRYRVRQRGLRCANFGPAGCAIHGGTGTTALRWAPHEPRGDQRLAGTRNDIPENVSVAGSCPRVAGSVGQHLRAGCFHFQGLPLPIHLVGSSEHAAILSDEDPSFVVHYLWSRRHVLTDDLDLLSRCRGVAPVSEPRAPKVQYDVDLPASPQLRTGPGPCDDSRVPPPC